MKKKKGAEDDELRIISSSFQKLLQLDEQERKIHRAQRKEIGTIKNVMDRLCDDKDIREKWPRMKNFLYYFNKPETWYLQSEHWSDSDPPPTLSACTLAESFFYPKKIVILSDNGSLLSYAENLMDKTVIMNKCERICM